MAKLVEEAQSSKTKSQRLIDKCSKYYTPAIILVSSCIAAVPAIMKVHNLNHWFHLALVVLVSACPCGLILSTPVATFCALTKAATSGLLIKSADYLDTLSKIKITAFDKTGTITRGEFIVVDFKSLHSDISLRSLLYWVSSVESKSSHPMAATIVDYAKSVDVEPRTEEVEDYQNFPGEGIYGKIDGNDIYIGNKRIASRANCSTVPEIEVDTKGGKTVGYIYVGERLAGVFNLSDACRSGVLQAMNELKDLGIKTAMLTGDNQDAAMHAQEQLGNVLDVVHGELLPEDKSRIIQEFKKDGATAMVGDGVNDAPALATADIGISMGISGSALATQTGHIILMSNDIRRIPQAIKLARRARRKVVENVLLSIVFKVGILSLAIAGHPLIWAAVLVDVGTCLLVILNSMLLLREKDKSKNKKCYRTSVINGKKLEGDADEEVDLEAGLLSRSQCNSGCCGDKKTQEKLMMMKKPSSKSSSDHGHSGCCGDKKTQDKVVMMKPSSKSSSDHGHSGCCGDKKQDNVKVVVKDSCCGEKTKKPDGDMASSSSCKKSTHVKHESLKSGSGCYGKDKEKMKEIVAKSCCEEKEKAENNVEMQILAVAGETCKTRCCGSKEKDKETSCLEKDVQETIKQSCHEKVCCGDTKEEVGEQCTTMTSEEETRSLDCWLESFENKTTVKQSCCEKTDVDIEAGVSCDVKLACCGNIEGEEVKEHITLACEEETEGSVCCHDKDCLESEADCCGDEITLASGCCVDKEEVTQLCHEKHVSKSPCCGTSLKQEGLSTLVSVEREMVKLPTDVVLQVKKVETCHNVKTLPEACGSKCSKREKRHSSGSCCRSYAKEYCSHRSHHHHHHHHHHHVGAA